MMRPVGGRGGGREGGGGGGGGWLVLMLPLTLWDELSIDFL